MIKPILVVSIFAILFMITTGPVFGTNYFLEEYRNRGYGTETLSYLRNIYQGCRIVLWVLKDNLKARKFYEKNQFAETGETRTINRGNEYIQVKYECHM